VHDKRAVDAAIDGAQAVINSVSLYSEHGEDTFHSMHVVAASRIASCAASAGVQRLVHVSGVGANASSPSLYIRKRGEGEAATRAAFPGACLVRPTVMFGDGDRFLTPLRDLLVRLPVFPLFGRGMTRLQPVHVNDVAEAIAQLTEASSTAPTPFELGGAEIYTYREIVRALAQGAGVDPVLLPVPFGVWDALALLSARLPNAPITSSQVDLMRLDNVVSGKMPGFDALRMKPRSLGDALPDLPHIGAI
jgi:NADH dehydrogenase